MKKSILDVIKERVLSESGYSYTIDEDLEDCSISVHFDTRVMYQSLFESLSKVSPLLKRNGFNWQLYVDYHGFLSLMIF